MQRIRTSPRGLSFDVKLVRLWALEGRYKLKGGNFLAIRNGTE